MTFQEEFTAFLAYSGAMTLGLLLLFCFIGNIVMTFQKYKRGYNKYIALKREFYKRKAA